MSGFIQLSREFFKSKEWKERRSLSDAEAMLYLIGKAGLEAKTELYKGKYVRMQAGELMASVRFLAEEWSWSKDRVNRFLSRLTQKAYISRRVEKGEGIIELKRFISRFETGIRTANATVKKSYNHVINNDYKKDRCDQSRQQMRQKVRQPCDSCATPIIYGTDTKRIEGHLAAEGEQKEKPPLLSPSFFPLDPPFILPL